MKKIILPALLSSAVAYADIHADMMSTVEFETTREVSLETESGDVSINYSGMSYEYKSKDFIRHAGQASDMFPDFLEASGVSATRCRTQEINVYDVETEVLNQERIRETVNWSDPNRTGRTNWNMLGLYEKGESSRVPATIYTDIRLYTADRMRIISHEMYHFWHDQYCLSRQGINSEEMAQAFETFYRENVYNPTYRRPYSQ
jgi:nicotinamide mononucleotide adenylyltransferase